MTTAISMFRACAMFGDWPDYRVNEKSRKAPHLLFPQFLDDSDPKQREIGLKMGLRLLERCDELWLCTGQLSFGMKRELKHAQRLGMTVRDRTQDWSYLAAAGAVPCMYPLA